MSTRKTKKIDLGFKSKARLMLQRASSPVVLALGYLLLASSTSVAMAYIDGRLLQPQLLLSGGRTITVVPLLANFSTLTDFVLLNPLIIYCLSVARRQRRAVSSLNGDQLIAGYHKAGLITLSVVLSVAAMKFYVDGFRQFFDATIIPGPDGKPSITPTGWIVFFWTTLFMAILLYGCVEQAFYAAYTLRLADKDIPYTPFHKDGCAGVRFIIDPSLTFMWAMIFLLLVFLVFIIHDRILYHIDDSKRLWGFALYISIAIPLFALPFLHLHRLMKHRRSEYLFDTSATANELLSSLSRARDTASQKYTQDLLSTVDNIRKYQKLVREFPVWPLPGAISVPPLGTILAALIPLAQKAAAAILPHIGTASLN